MMRTLFAEGLRRFFDSWKIVGCPATVLDFSSYDLDADSFGSPRQVEAEPVYVDTRVAEMREQAEGKARKR